MNRKWDPILKAAKTLFLEKGIAATSMDEVAARAGATKRTIYNNFKSKENLLEAVFAEAETEFRSAAPSLSSDAGVAELSAFAAAAVFSLTHEYAIGFQRLIVAERAAYGPIVLPLHEQAMSMLARPIETWLVKNRGLKPQAAKAKARNFLTSLTSDARLSRLMGHKAPYAVDRPVPVLDKEDQDAVKRFVQALTASSA